MSELRRSWVATPPSCRVFPIWRWQRVASTHRCISLLPEQPLLSRHQASLGDDAIHAAAPLANSAKKWLFFR